MSKPHGPHSNQKKKKMNDMTIVKKNILEKKMVIISNCIIFVKRNIKTKFGH